MRKITLQLFMVIILLSFASCDEGSEIAYLNNAENEPNTPSESTLPQEFPIDTEEPVVEDEIFVNDIDDPSSLDDFILPPTSLISDWRLVDFLMQYQSVYSFGWVNPTDGSYANWPRREAEGRPLVLESLSETPPDGMIAELRTWQDPMEWTVFYDRDGNRLDDAIFIDGEFYASGFRLYDLGYGEMPVILMSWSVLHSQERMLDVFAFSNGEYHLIGRLANDYYGRLLANYNGIFRSQDGQFMILHYHWWGGYFAYYLTYTENGWVKDSAAWPIFERGFDLEVFHRNCDCTEEPTITGSNISLTLVKPLADLHDEIMTALFPFAE